MSYQSLQGCLDDASALPIGKINVQAVLQQSKIKIVISDELSTFAASIYLDGESVVQLQQYLTDALNILKQGKL